MTQEEKAKHYDEALERASKLQENSNGMILKKWLWDVFPELKGSGDEQSKKWILEYLYDGLRKSDEQFKGQFKAAVAWLEKQESYSWKPSEEQLKALDYFYNNHYDTELGNYYEGVLLTLINDLYKLEKQNSPVLSNSSNIGKSEKCSADKIEPKFKVRGWITNGGTNPCYVKSIFGDYYELCSCEGFEYTKPIIDVNYTYHLWTIADAKDGDILVASDESIFIYANSTDRYAKFHLALTKYGQLNVDGGNWEDKNSVHPATIEQRVTLMEAMVDAGWEFDFERKELRKIEPKTLDADKVIEWLNENVADFWKSPCNPQNVIDKFKEDFEI